MPGQQTIEIGDVRCSLRFEKGFFQDEFNAVLSSYRRWGFCTECKPEISIKVGNDPIPQPDRLTANAFYHAMEYDSLYATMFFDTGALQGGIGISVKRVDTFTPVRIIELIETFISTAYLFYFFLHKKGAFIHSCGIADGENGYIFAGPSGEGKSTIAKLAGRRTVLCDEMVLLGRNGDGKKRVFGTPFSGESESSNRSADCKGIYFIEKSNTTELVRLSTASAAAALLKEGVMGGFLSINEIQRICPYPKYLFLLIDLLEGMPCYTLRFRKDNSFLELIHAQS
jgi:hypothetical protein